MIRRMEEPTVPPAIIPTGTISAITHTHTHTYKWTHTHTRTHTHAHAQTNTHTHAHMHTCTRTHADTHIHRRACERTHVHTRKHTQMHVHTHKCTHTHTNAHRHTHTHTRTHTHTHTHSLLGIVDSGGSSSLRVLLGVCTADKRPTQRYTTNEWKKLGGLSPLSSSLCVWSGPALYLAYSAPPPSPAHLPPYNCGKLSYNDSPPADEA